MGGVRLLSLCASRALALARLPLSGCARRSGGEASSCSGAGGVLLCLALSLFLFGRPPLSFGGWRGLGAGVFLALPHLHLYLQFSALDALAGMMMKGAAKCDKHAE